MADVQSVHEARLDRATGEGPPRLVATGSWTIGTVETLEESMPRVVAGLRGKVDLDLAGVDYIDTAGAWLIARLAEDLRKTGVEVERTGASANAQRLLDAVEPALKIEPAPERRGLDPFKVVELLGRSVANAGSDMVRAMAILGGVLRGLVRGIRHPSRLRITSIIFHIDRTGLQAVPIVGLISLLIGGIIAQQGIFQLTYFGAADFVVDLVGILVLRELGVLVTAIMIAGRSGSAFTAEVGSMKMREELDALTVIGLDPLEVLIMPRIVALIIALPLLTFLSDMAALAGGAFVAFVYGGMAFDRFIILLRDAVGLSTFFVGMIKAPFMGLIIGLVAANEGLNVGGSAESLGRQTTASVVKAIFMVIVADGFFAVFFAAINY